LQKPGISKEAPKIIQAYKCPLAWIGMPADKGQVKGLEKRVNAEKCK
jgi:hypothetical protein